MLVVNWKFEPTLGALQAQLTTSAREKSVLTANINYSNDDTCVANKANEGRA